MNIRQFGKVALAVFLLAGACDTKETIVEEDFDFDGSCIECHDGLSAGQVHATFKLRCVDCHGGNDQVEIPEGAAGDPDIFRDPDLVAQAHVAPKAGLARFFFANGVDDDGDGLVDETIEFDNTFAPTEVLDFGEIWEPGLQGQGGGEFVDAEYNRDLNYVRWLNPGDLRVATIGCGKASRPALDGEAGGACHQDIIEISRRSIMVNNAAVINGAMYGNESWRPTFFNARDNPNPQVDPRKGAFGYTLDFEGADGCIDTDDAEDADNPRGQAVFDVQCLEAQAARQDPNAAAGATGNVGLPAFDIAQGKIVGSAPGTEGGRTFAYNGVGGLSRYDWGGNELKDPAAVLDEIEFTPDETIATPFAVIPDPVDNILRGFRAYYPMNYIGSTGNFNFTFGTGILPEIAQFNTANPYGRAHSSGCTSCHMKYNFTGNRDPQVIQEYDPETGELNTFVVEDPTTKHREFDEAQDIRTINGVDLLIGATLSRKERIEAILGRFDAANPFSQQQEEDALAQQPQVRYYSANHTIDTRVDTDNCGLCHAFVTRIDFPYQGIAEDEQRDKLARIKPIEFSTPKGTQVTIHDSWVREEALDITMLGDKTLVVPSGVAIIEDAIERDQQIEEDSIADCGEENVLLPGFGGCAPTVFSEDCNNNGELDDAVTLFRVNEAGDVVCEITIDEDLNNNGRLDLISHVPRERSVDGRQQRYVYGGANGSTRLMDIHFEEGMHCIDCHMLQDTHGDGNIYSTNWEQIEIECEDCHGARDADGNMNKATLFTSGANGVNDLRNAIDHDGRPFFEDQGDRIIQRSRVTPGLFWEVPQMADVSNPDSPFFNPDAFDAHIVEHIPELSDPNDPVKKFTIGSEFAGEPGASEMTTGVLECWTCHTSWMHNCVGCHYNMNLGNTVKPLVNPDGSIDQVAGENETWFNNRNQAGRTNFQLLEFMRSPFVLGQTAAADSQRVGLFRSNMLVQVSVFDGTGAELVQDTNFTTFNELDANSGRQNVATSGSSMNQSMPHTVRPLETRSCEQCHALVDQQGRVQNDHILAEAFGLGAGSLSFVGNHAFVAGTPNAGGSGLEAYEFKDENELLGSNVPAVTATNANRFPGIILNPGDRVPAGVEPTFDDAATGIDAAATATDVVFIRNFNPTPAVAGGTQPPTLQDIAVMSIIANGGGGRILISNVTLRSHPAGAEQDIGTLSTVVNLGNQPANALAHIGADVSDPFVYVAHGTTGLSVIEILNEPTQNNAANLVTSVAIPGNRTATEVTLAGDVAYVGTAEGTIEVFDLANPRQPQHRTSVNVDNNPVTGIEVGAFYLFASTDGGGLVVADILDPFVPKQAPGASGFLLINGVDGKELSISNGHVYLAAGTGGVLDIDVTTPAAPVNNGNIIATVSNEAVDAQDVIIHTAAGPQVWLLIADGNGGDLVGVKLDGTQSTRERCLPNNTCGLDMNWRDPTIMGRDPGFDAAANQFFDAAVDPSGPPFFRMASQNMTSARRIARPVLWEKIGTLTGRRYRDSFMPGSGVLSLPVMQKMYETEVCVEPNSEDINGNGLGRIGLVENGCVPASEPIEPAAAAGQQSNTCVVDFSHDTGSSCELPDAGELAPPES